MFSCKIFENFGNSFLKKLQKFWKNEIFKISNFEIFHWFWKFFPRDKNMSAEGFEPSPNKWMRPERTALDHSAKLTVTKVLYKKSLRYDRYGSCVAMLRGEFLQKSENLKFWNFRNFQFWDFFKFSKISWNFFQK